MLAPVSECLACPYIALSPLVLSSYSPISKPFLRISLTMTSVSRDLSGEGVALAVNRGAGTPVMVKVGCRANGVLQGGGRLAQVCDGGLGCGGGKPMKQAERGKWILATEKGLGKQRAVACATRPAENGTCHAPRGTRLAPWAPRLPPHASRPTPRAPLPAPSSGAGQVGAGRSGAEPGGTGRRVAGCAGRGGRRERGGAGRGAVGQSVGMRGFPGRGGAGLEGQCGTRRSGVAWKGAGRVIEDYT